jgi:hypothetical protein
MSKHHSTVTAAIAAILSAAALTPALAQAGPAGAATRTATVSPAEGPAPTCIVHSLPAFTAQGEQATTGTVADIVEVECNPEIYGTKAPIRITADQLYMRCERSLTWYVPNAPLAPNSDAFVKSTGNGVTLELDPDGNATVALRAGPNCMAGESLITAHMQRYPYESFTTSFSVLPPQPTPLGVRTMPASQVVDAYSSAFATIIQAEFPGISEQNVRIGSEELYHRCHLAPHLRWIGIDGSETTGVSEVTGVPIDNAGNAFVIVVGDASCAPGGSLIEADLEESPFTTLKTTFDDEPPQPTAEPAFTIEKRQQINGSTAAFTTSPLKASLGQTVDYQITVKNTASVAETVSEFADPHCDPGTLAGEGVALAPGASATYTCRHLLTAVGSYVNEATATATTVGGVPLTRTSNQVLVEVPPAPPSEQHTKQPPEKPPPHSPSFTIEKLQRVPGQQEGFTTQLLNPVPKGSTILYEIVVRNTDSLPLTFSGFTDAHCDAGTIAGGPGPAPLPAGSTTTYTCAHVMGAEKIYVNQASVTAASTEGPSATRTSNPVTAENMTLCSFESVPLLHGASGARRGPFTVKITSTGIERIILWLDKHRLAILTAAQAKHNKFAIRIDPRRLSLGAHHLMARITTSPECPSSRVLSSFVHVAPPAPPPG